MARGKSPSPGKDYGAFIVLGGERVAVRKHKTDFTVMAPQERVAPSRAIRSERLAARLTRVSTATASDRDTAMDEVRARNVAHHIYQVEKTGEDILIADRVILELKREGTGALERIMQDHHLQYVTRMGDAHVLRLTNDTNSNPVKLANLLSERDDVASCTPELVMTLQYHQFAPLFPEQWYLTTDLLSDPDVVPNADIDVVEAWQVTTGSPDIVVAVIDDGFDLGHPALQGVRIHPDARDFAGLDAQPEPDPADYHGTPVASIAVGQHGTGNAMRGVAPGCTFLPVRIGFGGSAAQIDILEVFRYVSARADVVNCSFGLPPTSFDPFARAFRSEITRMAETGGRRGKGLVFVFSAANDDAPTFLEADQNINGVRFTRFTDTGAAITEIPAGSRVFSGYPMTRGVVTVSAMSSFKRKSGYSSWGPHVTVTAPSNNMHYITAFVRPGADPRRDQFVAHYRGRGQVAACNRPGHGSPFSPIMGIDDPSTTQLREDLYTRAFGGTSGAAPIVTGIVGLMLSANPTLSAEEVRNILASTADRDLDPTLDLANDPNVQGLSGAFVGGQSLFFGHGKVNAFRAVTRARALGGGPEPGPAPAPAGEVVRESAPALAIPDNRPEGVVSAIDIEPAGALGDIEVAVDIAHTWRGDLKVTLITPQGFTALLHRLEGGSAQNLSRRWGRADNPDLDALARGGIEIRGRWTLHVADQVRRDVGTLRSWRLRLVTRTR